MSIRNWKKKFSNFIALFFFFTPSLWAQGHIYVAGSMAASFALFSHNNPQISYFSGTTITDDYPLTSYHPETTVFGGIGGYEFTGSGWKPAVAFGLGVYGNLADYNFEGQVIKTTKAAPSKTLYNYTYHLTGMRLMAEMQLNWMLTQLSPFFNLGLGTAWNSMTGYKETSVNSTDYPPLLPFRSQNNNNFAYQVGCGVSVAFNSTNTKSTFLHERISLGYRYVNLGSASFGTRDPNYPYRLNPGLFQTNEFYFAYTYLF